MLEDTTVCACERGGGSSLLVPAALETEKSRGVMFDLNSVINMLMICQADCNAWSEAGRREGMGDRRYSSAGAPAFQVK
jgi:hypothetical protein